MRHVIALAALSAAAGCGELAEVGRPPGFTPVTESAAYRSMTAPGQPDDVAADPAPDPSLWASGRESLLGDRRADTRGDLLTVTIEIDDNASVSNSSSRSRDGSESLAISDLFGLPEVAEDALPAGATLDPALGTNASSSYSGDGSVERSEQLELRLAAVVTEVMENGVLKIEGTQEVRVNYELRELTITGFVRPQDISRQNEIPYDKIAAARISYGGRGQIDDVQQPRYGQQIADILLPF